MPGGQDLHNVPRPGSRLGSSPGGHGQGVVDVAVARGQGNSTRRQDRGQCGGLSFILKPQWVASLRQMEGRLRRGWDRQAGRQLQSSFQDGAWPLSDSEPHEALESTDSWSCRQAHIRLVFPLQHVSASDFQALSKTH